MYFRASPVKYFVAVILLIFIIWKRNSIVYHYKDVHYKISWKFYKMLGDNTGLDEFHYSKKRVFEGLVFDQPMMIRENSNSFFVAEKSGKIKKINPGGDRVEVFLDVTKKVSGGYYNGLYNFAFHPYDSVLAVSYSLPRKSKGNRDLEIIELFSFHDKGVQYASSRILYQFNLKDHFGGGLEFDREGYLFIGIGDLESSDPDNQTQSLESLAGKILRLKINKLSGEIPLDNPFSAVKFAKKEIWASGFRNPFRMSFLENGKTLVVADVGHDETEEIDIVKAGKNFGWSIKEGTHPFKNIKSNTILTDPVYEYEHGVEGFSITGGFVYEGGKFPELKKKYIFGDYITGRIWSLDLSELKPHAKLLVKNAGGITSFCQTSAGEIFWTDLSTNKIYKLVKGQ
jgi:glucose/arabinose dehydrogenase